MARWHRITVYPTIQLIVGDEGSDIQLEVAGMFYEAQRAYTYRGETAPTDPPEPACFEFSKISWNGKPFELPFTYLQLQELENACIELAESRLREGM